MGPTPSSFVKATIYLFDLSQPGTLPYQNRNTLMGGTLLYSAGLQKMGNVGSGRTISILYHMFYKKERNYPIVRIIRLTQTLLITTTEKIGKFSNNIQCKN